MLYTQIRVRHTEGDFGRINVNSNIIIPFNHKVHNKDYILASQKSLLFFLVAFKMEIVWQKNSYDWTSHRWHYRDLVFFITLNITGSYKDTFSQSTAANRI